MALTLREIKITKIIKNGKVAVLYSPGYGAGWHFWNKRCEECIFDGDIVNLVESGASADAIEKAALRKWPDGYWGGARDLKIAWLDKGALFRISEYDGFESIEFNYNCEWVKT